MVSGGWLIARAVTMAQAAPMLSPAVSTREAGAAVPLRFFGARRGGRRGRALGISHRRASSSSEPDVVGAAVVVIVVRAAVVVVDAARAAVVELRTVVGGGAARAGPAASRSRSTAGASSRVGRRRGRSWWSPRPGPATISSMVTTIGVDGW